jgi:hypothetical protein
MPPAAKSSGRKDIGSMLVKISLRKGTILRLSMKRSPVKTEGTRTTSTSLSSRAVPLGQDPKSSALSTEIPLARRTYFFTSLITDPPAKSRHPLEEEDPCRSNLLKALDSRLRGNDLFGF